LFKVLKATVGLRVSRDEELEGLDLTEHGSEAYPVEVGARVTDGEPAAVPVPT
jgi:ammonia channel protein AmtB